MAQPPSGPPKSWPGAKTPEAYSAEWLKGSETRLKKLKGAAEAGSDLEKLTAALTDLLNQARALQEKSDSKPENKTDKKETEQSLHDYRFRYGRQLIAANALMDTADRILLARGITSGAENGDFWGAGFILQGCYFRVRQADYFADISGDKNAGQYVKLASSLYQQGRSAYDAREYRRARLLGDAASSVVFALECLAQAATPDPHIYK